MTLRLVWTTIGSLSVIVHGNQCIEDYCHIQYTFVRRPLSCFVLRDGEDCGFTVLCLLLWSSQLRKMGSSSQGGIISIFFLIDFAVFTMKSLLQMTTSETFEAVGKALISNHLAEDSPEFWEKLKAKTTSDFRCICCLNVLRQEEAFQLCEEIAAGIEELDSSTTNVMLDIQIAPAIEVCRVMSRSIIKESAKPNPRFETVLEKMITWYLQTRKQIEVKPDAAMKVTVHFDMQRQMDLCLSVFPDFRPKKQRKRTFGATEDGENNKNGQSDKDEDEISISQSNIGK